MHQAAFLALECGDLVVCQRDIVIQSCNCPRDAFLLVARRYGHDARKEIVGIKI